LTESFSFVYHLNLHIFVSLLFEQWTLCPGQKVSYSYVAHK